MNGYQAVSIWTSSPPPTVPERGKNESLKQFLSRVEMHLLDQLMGEMKRAGVTLLHRYATLDRLHLVVEDDETVLSSEAEVCPLFPSPDDEWVRDLHLLGKGMYGKAYTVRLDGACWRAIDPRWGDLQEDVTYEIPAVVKESIGKHPIERYQSTLQEILINQMVLRPTLLHSELPSHFPLMYSFIACEPNLDKTYPHFCAVHPTIEFEDLSLTQREQALRKGSLELFPVFERVEGVTLEHVMRDPAFDPDHIDLLENWLVQIFATLDVINQQVMYAHNDLHVENIMVMATRAATFTYSSSPLSGGAGDKDDSSIILEPMMRVVIIDQGLAGGSFTHHDRTYLAYYQLSTTIGHQGCMMVSDIFRVFRSLWVEWPRDTFGRLVLEKMLVVLFGEEILSYIRDRVSSFDTWLEYVIYLHHQHHLDRFHSVIGLTHRDVLTLLDRVMKEVRAQRTDYSSPRVQDIVRRRVEQHLSSSSSSSSTLRDRLQAFLSSPSASTGRRVEQTLNRLHRRLRRRGERCACLPMLRRDRSVRSVENKK